MTYQLPSGPSPDCEILVDAVYADPLHQLANVGQRLAEVTDGAGTALAIVKSGGLHIGTYDIVRHAVSNPVPVAEYGRNLRLEEQIAVVASFRKLASGPGRRLLAEVADAMDAKRAILVVRDFGVVIVIPVDFSDVHRLVAIRLDGARTIEQERLCVEVARESRSTWELVWHAVQEHRRATEPVETDPYDVLEAPVQHAYTPSRISEEDAIDGLEEGSWGAEHDFPDDDEAAPSEPDEEHSIGTGVPEEIFDDEDEIRF